MKRRSAMLMVPGVFSIWILAIANRQASMLGDSDTRVLLENMIARNQPWSWFLGDWPLFNHFYRPISTLTFEFDRIAHPGNAAWFGFTNALICALALWAAFWMFNELSDQPLVAGLATGFFGLAHVFPPAFAKFQSVCWLLACVAFLGLARGTLREKLPSVLAAAGSLAFLTLIFPSPPFDWKYRIVDWLPGRTASTMAVFGFLTIASFARWIRTSSVVQQKPATPLDVPPTKSSRAESITRSNPWWLAISIVAAALALGSYEQAVMIPAIATGLLIMFALQGRRPIRWWSVATLWVLLAGYLALRYALLPHDVSGYQAQQFRTGPGVWLDIGFYAMPVLSSYTSIVSIGASGLLGFFLVGPYALLSQIMGNAYVWWRMARQQNWLMVGSLLMALVAFLPMAWLKTFGHYHYFPGGFFSLFAACATILAFRTLRAAISPPVLRADSYETS